MDDGWMDGCEIYNKSLIQALCLVWCVLLRRMEKLAWRTGFGVEDARLPPSPPIPIPNPIPIPAHSRSALLGSISLN